MPHQQQKILMSNFSQTMGNQQNKQLNINTKSVITPIKLYYINKDSGDLE